MTRTLISAVIASTLVVGAPLLAQDAGKKIERKVVVIDRDTDAHDGEVQREVTLRRIRTDGEPAADADDRRERIEVKIVKLEGELSEASPAKVETLILDGEAADCESADGGDVKLRICAVGNPDSLLSALREARAEIARDGDLGDERRRRALAALDERIAALEADSPE